MHYGMLSDGTEASLGDLVFSEHVVAAVADISLPLAPTDESVYVRAAHAVRAQYPELGRTEILGCFMAAVPFDRILLDEEEARNAVKVDFERHSTDEACQHAVQSEVQSTVLLHPMRLGLLRWRVSVHFGSNIVSLAFFGSHADTDGMGVLRVMRTFVDRLTDPVPGPRGPLMSSMPSDRVHFGLAERLRAWIEATYISTIQPYIPSLWGRSGLERKAPVGRVTSTLMEVAELDAASTAALLKLCKLKGVRVGSVLAAAMARVIEGDRSSHFELGLSVDMRSRFKPPIPSSVVAPQHGEVSVALSWASDDSFWTLAAQVEKQMDQHLAQGPQAILFSDLVIAYKAYSWPNQARHLTYPGVDWLSNCGIFPAPANPNSIPVLRAWLANKPISPAFRLIWSTTIRNGPMTLSNMIDESVFQPGEKKLIAEDMVEFLKKIVR